MHKTILLVLTLLIVFIVPTQAFIARTTSYCGSEDGNYKNCQGQRLVEGMCAADLRVYALGTQILINGEKFVVADCGSAIRGARHFDIFCKTLKEMKRRGTVYADVKVIKTPQISLYKPKNTHLARSSRLHKDFKESSCYFNRSEVYSSKPRIQFESREELVCMEF